MGSGNLTERAGRASLMRELQRLRPVFPTTTPKATLPSSTDSPPPASSSSVPKRRSNGAADFFSGFEVVDLDLHPTRDANSLSKEANCIMELSNDGDVMFLVVEEFLLASGYGSQTGLLTRTGT